MLQEFGPMPPLMGERDIPMETQVSDLAQALARISLSDRRYFDSSNTALEQECGDSYVSLKSMSEYIL